jgi:hypothetical protein
MTAPDEHHGSCFCGQVRYRIRGPVKFVAHDHCSICRRIAGAAFVTWCGVKATQFELVAGESELTTFASTPEATRQFCKHCGSHLFFRSSRWPGEVHVTLATLHVTPDALTALSPKAHVFYSDKAPWMDLTADLPRCGGPSGIDPLDG